MIVVQKCMLLPQNFEVFTHYMNPKWLDYMAQEMGFHPKIWIILMKLEIENL